jgi:hypothetical protein
VFRGLLVAMMMPVLASNLMPKADANDIPYCDEIEGKGGLCVTRDPIETYLVVSYVGAANGKHREIRAGFHTMRRSQCLEMLELKFTRCYRIGMYTDSEKEFVRGDYGDKSAVEGAMTYRETFDYIKMPRSDVASSADIQLQMTTVDGSMIIFSEVGNCFRETGNTADCATLWIEPFTTD